MNTIINNRIKALVGLVLGITTLFGLFAFATPAAAASDVTCNSAVVSAWVDPQGSPTIAWMQWGTSPSLSGSTFSSTPHTYNSYDTISATATGLSENTTYYYRGRFNNASRGAWNGDILSFKTLSCGGGNPPPTSLSCKLDYNATPTPHNINKGVKFEVFGGNGSYNWITDGNSDFESGSNRMRNWISWSSAGKKYVKVESGNLSANCGSANIIDNTPPPPAAQACTLDISYNPTTVPYGGSLVVSYGGTNVASGTAEYNFDNKGYVSLYPFPGPKTQNNLTDVGTHNIKLRAKNSAGVTCYSNTASYTVLPPAQAQTYTVTASAGQGGSISPSSRQVTAGNTTSFKVTAYSGYYISSVSGCSGNLNGSTYVTGPINSNCHVYANFNQNDNPPPPPPSQKYIVTASAGQGGSISPSSRQVTAGNTTSFTVTPYSGYTISSVSGCNGDLSGNTYVTGPIYSNCQVYASFNQNNNQNTIVDLIADDYNISYGETTWVRWYPDNADYCNASGGTNGWAGSKTSTNGSFYTGALYSNTTYNITCTNNAGGSASDSVTISVGNNNDNGDGPDVTTRDATSVDTEDAVLNGHVDGNNLSTRAWFEYGTSRSNLNRSTSRISYGSGSTSFNEFIDNLEEDTTYYFRAMAENSEGTDEGSILSFSTDEDDDNDNDEGPDVTTRNATNVSSSEATLNGRVDGNGRTTRAWFEYGTSTSLGYSTTRTSYGSGSTNYDRTIYGLMPNTTYYFRAMAENSEDTDRGSILSFFTTGGYVPPVNNQPTVVIYADSTNLAYNSSTTIRWGTVNATSCIASGGSAGWAGIKSIGPGSFYTGSLASTRTYTISCSNNYGSSTDSVTVRVRGQVITDPVIPTSYVIINSSVDRNQPIVPTIDNTRPHPGDEINYTVTYQNIGNASITGLTLRLDLPYEVDYMFSNPSNPTRSGNTLIFSLGTLRANAQGTVTVRVRVRENIPAGTYLNFPAILSYVDPSGHMQSVNANVSAQIWSEPVKEEVVQLGANVFGAGFFPTNIFGWLLLIILILLLVYLAKYIFGQPGQLAPFSKKTTTTTIQH